ncbi:MAG: hypothetical protein FWG03_03815 [Clostridiales bacterium]|nr:hypothetical protein [Clostridiales bacterium]
MALVADIVSVLAYGVCLEFVATEAAGISGVFQAVDNGLAADQAAGFKFVFFID